MVVLTVAALRNGALPAGVFALGEFKAAPFMTVFVIVGGFQLGWAPYVSDYSRYLPSSVGVRATFWWTYLPSSLSMIWVCILGAVDYSLFIGLPLWGTLYCALCRSLDLDAERRLVAEEGLLTGHTGQHSTRREP